MDKKPIYNKEEFNLDFVRQAMSKYFEEKGKELGVQYLGDGIYYINIGNHGAYTNAAGVEEFNKALKEQVND